jgi:hypothetical protein
MAERPEQGTGRRPHKSSEEPWEHHEASKSEHRESRSENSGSERRDSRSESSGSERREARSERGEERSSRRADGESESRDLKECQYRDKEGNIHHHTHTSEAMLERCQPCDLSPALYIYILCDLYAHIPMMPLTAKNGHSALFANLHLESAMSISATAAARHRQNSMRCARRSCTRNLIV